MSRRERSGVGERNGSVVRRIQLGRALRRYRLDAGYSVEAAAPKLDWSSSKLSRIENGQQGVDVHGVKSMLDLYGVAGAEWTEMIALTREVRQRGWWRAYGLDDLGYVPLEAEAASVREFTIGTIPGLLQTADYARAIFRHEPRDLSETQVRNGVTVRLIRQRRLTSDENPLSLVAVIDEAVLRREVGGAEVMRRQLRHMLDAMAAPTVTVQVLPQSVGAHPGLTAGFVVLDFGELGVADMAYVEHPMGAVHIDKDADVETARLVFKRLRSLALSPSDSAALIERLVATM